jgi:hypothetical protein
MENSMEEDDRGYYENKDSRCEGVSPKADKCTPEQQRIAMELPRCEGVVLLNNRRSGVQLPAILDDRYL